MIEGEYLLHAVRNRLRNNLNNLSGTTTASNNKSILVMPNEKVPAWAGEEFIGVYGASLNNLYPVPNNITKESYSISIGLTRRIQTQPVGRLGETIYTEDVEVYDRIKPSMLRRARQIMNLIVGVWQVVADANEMAQDGECKFLTPLGLLSADAQPKYVDEDHFFTEPDSTKFHKGLFIEISLGGAEFVVPH